MFDSTYYERLKRLKLAIEKKSTASLIGSRKSSRKGSSAEFSDFREYMPGDDIRNIDWNAYARLDRLYIKEYMEEKESSVSIFLDTSLSMTYMGKDSLMKDLAAALSYIALVNMDQVKVYDLADVGNPHNASGGKASFTNLLKKLDMTECSGSADIYKAIRQSGRMTPGMTIILSDFMSEEFMPGGDSMSLLLKYLKFMKQDTVILHVLAKEELDIDLVGTYNLIDMENEEDKVKVTMDRRNILEYKKRLEEFTGGIKESCKRFGAAYYICDTGRSFDRIIFEDMRELYD